MENTIVMKNLEQAIEEGIADAKAENRAIPGALYREPVDYSEVPEDESVPYYDSVSRTWKVVTEWGREEGDAIYIAGEMVISYLVLGNEMNRDERNDVLIIIRNAHNNSDEELPSII